MGMKTLALMAFAVALGAAGCRNQNRGEAVGPTGGDTTMGGAEAEPQAGTEKVMNYTIDKIEGDNVHLQLQEAGEVEAQAGRELQVTKAEFLRMAGSEAVEGMAVRVHLGADGKPQTIEYLIREEVPESETEPAPQ